MKNELRIHASATHFGVQRGTAAPKKHSGWTWKTVDRVLEGERQRHFPVAMLQGADAAGLSEWIRTTWGPGEFRFQWFQDTGSSWVALAFSARFTIMARPAKRAADDPNEPASPAAIERVAGTAKSFQGVFDPFQQFLVLQQSQAEFQLRADERAERRAQERVQSDREFMASILAARSAPAAPAMTAADVAAVVRAEIATAFPDPEEPDDEDEDEVPAPAEGDGSGGAKLDPAMMPEWAKNIAAISAMFGIPVEKLPGVIKQIFEGVAAKQNGAGPAPPAAGVPPLIQAQRDRQAQIGAKAVQDAAQAAAAKTKA